MLTHETTLSIAAALDQWRTAAGVVYPSERIDADVPLARLPEEQP